MVLHNILDIIYFFILLSSFFMVFSNNPINSVFFLIIVFFFNSILFMLLNCDIIGIFILIIYVGAIAVLFLFIVMLINLKRIDKDNTTYLIVGAFFFIFLFELIFLFIFFFYFYFFSSLEYISFDFLELNVLDFNNKDFLLFFIGFYIYIKDSFFLLCCDLILVLSMGVCRSIMCLKSNNCLLKQKNQLLINSFFISSYIY